MHFHRTASAYKEIDCKKFDRNKRELRLKK